MQQFKTDPTHFEKIEKKLLSSGIVLGIVSIAFAVIAFIFPGNKEDGDFKGLAIVIPIIVLAICYGLYSAIDRQGSYV